MSQNCILCHCEIVDKSEESEVNDNVVCEECSTTNIYENARLFGKFIYLLRERYRWSRKFVAEKLGFNSETSVMNFETGKTQMRTRHISRFCNATPNKLSVPVLYAMYEAGSLEPPCKCICHHDRGNQLPDIYDDKGECQLCNHRDGDCNITNGLWFERKDFHLF